MLDELEAIKNLSCEGIGLFRTEFLYLGKQSLPSEEEQFAVYKELAEKMNPLPVTIRTFDLGGDKLAPLSSGKTGRKSLFRQSGYVRFSLSYPDIFSTQVRAILRASAFWQCTNYVSDDYRCRGFPQSQKVCPKLSAGNFAQGIACKPKIPWER